MRMAGYVNYSVFIFTGCTNQVRKQTGGVTVNGGSYRNHVYTIRKYVNPSVLFNLGKKTTLQIGGDYLRESITPDFGIGSLNNGREHPEHCEICSLSSDLNFDKSPNICKYLKVSASKIRIFFLQIFQLIK